MANHVGFVEASGEGLTFKKQTFSGVHVGYFISLFYPLLGKGV